MLATSFILGGKLVQLTDFFFEREYFVHHFSGKVSPFAVAKCLLQPECLTPERTCTTAQAPYDYFVFRGVLSCHAGQRTAPSNGLRTQPPC